MKIRNYTGINLRMMEAKGERLSVKRFYPVNGTATVSNTVAEMLPVDGVAAGVLRSVVDGLVGPFDLNTALIVRLDVANVILRTETLAPMLLIPYDPVLVPEKLQFQVAPAAQDCVLLNGMLGGSEAKRWLSQGYVRYGYRRLVAVVPRDEVDFRLIFPVNGACWANDESRQADLWKYFSEMMERAAVIGCQLTRRRGEFVLTLPNQHEEYFTVSDAELSRLALRLDELKAASKTAK